MNSLHEIYVGIVTYNSAEQIKDCLDSLLVQKNIQLTISILDNNSSDSTCALIREEYPDIELLKETSNLGFGNAHNKLMNHKDWDYYLCLNPDVILEPNFLFLCCQAMSKDPSIGAVNGMVLYYKNSEKCDDIFSLGHQYTQERRIESLGIGANYHSFDLKEQFIFGPNGSCPLFRKKALATSALPGSSYFEPSFFMYCEDEELAWRLNKNNFKTLSLPSAVAWHIGGASKPMANPKAVTDSIANRYLSLIRHDDPILFLKAAPFFLFVELSFLIINTVKRPSFFIAWFKALLKTIRFAPSFYQSRKEQKKVDRESMKDWFQPFNTQRFKQLITRHKVRKNPHSIYTK